MFMCRTTDKWTIATLALLNISLPCEGRISHLSHGTHKQETNCEIDKKVDKEFVKTKKNNPKNSSMTFQL